MTKTLWYNGEMDKDVEEYIRDKYECHDLSVFTTAELKEMFIDKLTAVADELRRFRERN